MFNKKYFEKSNMSMGLHYQFQTAITVANLISLIPNHIKPLLRKI